MKTAEEWMEILPDLKVPWSEQISSGYRLVTADAISIIQNDAFKAGQEATMKWVGEECRRQTERLIELQQKPETLC